MPDTPSSSAPTLAERLNRWALPAGFFLLLLLPLALFGRPTPFGPAVAENRVLAPFPKPSRLWPRQFEAWYQDRYGLRDVLVRAGARAHLGLLGRPAHRQVMLGANGWLYYDEAAAGPQPEMADVRGRLRFSEEELARIARNLTQAQEGLAACGIHFQAVIAPDKQTVYPEYLKLYRIPPGATTRLDQLIAHLARHAPQVRLLDVRPELAAAKARHEMPLYYRTDTHWNDLGAFIAYRALMRQLEKAGAARPGAAADLDAYRVRSRPFRGGDITNNMLSLPDRFEDEKVRLRPQAGRLAKPAPPPEGLPGLDSAYPVLAFARPGGSLRLLIYRDSFATAWMPFLAESFAQTTAIWQPGIHGEHIRRTRPDVVVLELVERLAHGLLEPPRELERACGGS